MAPTIIEENENALAPKIVGIYPPIVEATTAESIIIFLSISFNINISFTRFSF